MNIIKKTQEWAAQYGSVLNVSAETRLPWLYKGAVGGLEHVISADNGGAYIELWRDGTGSYYATTGAKITQMPGLAKGAKLDEALDKFFALTAKLQRATLRKGKTYRDRADVTQPSARTKSPFKKNIIQNVDPQIGPQFSVGHMKPSDLSPESSMKNKAIRKAIRDIGKAMKGGRIGADGKVIPSTPVGMGGVGQPTGYGATGMPHYSYQRKAGTPRDSGAGMPKGLHGHRGSKDFSSSQEVHSHASGSRSHKHNPYQSHRRANQPWERAAKKNIVGLSGKDSAGASGNFQPSRINRPEPKGRMLQTDGGPKNYPFPGQAHGSEGIHSHDYGKNKRGTHDHGVPGQNLPHSAVGTRSNFHNENMWLKPQKKALKKCTPCELKKAVRAATKAVATPGGVE